MAHGWVCGSTKILQKLWENTKSLIPFNEPLIDLPELFLQQHEVKAKKLTLGNAAGRTII